ncbi:YecR family lipoprotein [Escherichia coli]
MSEFNAATGIVRLSYSQAFAACRPDRYVSHRDRRSRMPAGRLSHAVPFGQPVGNCSLFADLIF